MPSKIDRTLAVHVASDIYNNLSKMPQNERSNAVKRMRRELGRAGLSYPKPKRGTIGPVVSLDDDSKTDLDFFNSLLDEPQSESGSSPDRGESKESKSSTTRRSEAFFDTMKNAQTTAVRQRQAQRDISSTVSNILSPDDLKKLKGAPSQSRSSPAQISASQKAKMDSFKDTSQDNENALVLPLPPRDRPLSNFFGDKVSRLESFRHRVRGVEDVRRSQDRKIGKIIEPNNNDLMDEKHLEQPRRDPVRTNPYSTTANPFVQQDSGLDFEMRSAEILYNNIYGTSPANTSVDPQTKGARRPRTSASLSSAQAIAGGSSSPPPMSAKETKADIEKMGGMVFGRPMSKEGIDSLDGLDPEKLQKLLDVLKARFRGFDIEKQSSSTIIDGELFTGDESILDIARELARTARGSFASARGSISDVLDAGLGFVDTARDVVNAVEDAKSVGRFVTGVAQRLITLTGTETEEEKKTRKIGDPESSDDPDQKIRDRVGQINGQDAPSKGTRPKLQSIQEVGFPEPDEYFTNVKLIQNSVNSFLNDVNLYGDVTGVGLGAGDPDLHR